MESSAAEPAPKPKRRHITVVSPSLARDFARVKRAAPYLAIALVLVVAYLVALFASGLVMGPQDAWTRVFAKPSRLGLSPRTVSFQTSDGIPIKAWWERSWNVDVPKGTVILAHGSQTNKTGMGYVAARLLPQGFSVLVLDLRAHGESGGDYTTFGYKEALDVEAGVRWVRANAREPRIALMGYSSGAVAVLLAAAKTQGITAVVADSAYVDTFDVLRREQEFLKNPPPNTKVPFGHRLRLFLFTAPGFSWLAQEAFRLRSGVPFHPPEANVVDAVRHIDRAPVLYLAAEKDPVVPRAVTEQLYRATASSNKQLSLQPGAFHSAMAGDPRAFITAVTTFLDAAFGTQPVAVPAVQPKP